MSRGAHQTTIARSVSKEGIGLHTGAQCLLRLLPAEANAGIVFVSEEGVEIPALAGYVAATERATSLGLGQARVHTVEHLLAALYALGVDNVRVELTGPEVPACDGSARDWAALVGHAGLRRQGAVRRVWSLRRPVWVGEGDWWAMALPAARFAVAVGVEFAGTVAGRQSLWLAVTPGRFASELAPARTFALARELEAVRAAGLAQGGGPENAFAVGPEGYSGPLRFPDEVARHKALDLVGDLALCGYRFRGQVVAVRPRHGGNVALAGALRSALAEEAAGAGTRTCGEEDVA